MRVYKRKINKYQSNIIVLFITFEKNKNEEQENLCQIRVPILLRKSHRDYVTGPGCPPDSLTGCHGCLASTCRLPSLSPLCSHSLFTFSQRCFRTKPTRVPPLQPTPSHRGAAACVCQWWVSCWRGSVAEAGRGERAGEKAMSCPILLWPGHSQ